MHRIFGLASELRGKFVHDGVELAGRRATVNESDAVRLRGVDCVAQHHHFACAGRADLRDQPRHSAPRQRNTEIDLRQREASIVGRHPKIACQRQCETAAEDVPVEPSNRDNLTVGNGLARAVADLGVPASFAFADTAQAWRLLQIRTGRNDRPRPPSTIALTSNRC